MGKFRQYKVSTSKLSPEQVFRMRELYHTEGWSQGRLAREFKMSVGQVGRIVRGESWQQYNMPENEEAQAMHNRGLLMGRDLAAEAAESEKRFNERFADVAPLAQPKLAMPLSAEARERLRAYGSQVDEPEGSGLERLASELKGYSPEDEVRVEDDLNRFLTGEGDSK